MNSPVVYITITGMILSVLLLLYNYGFRKANAYLAGFFFLSSLSYLIQYTFIFSHSLSLIIWFAAGLPSTSYLIGPFAFLYVRSILKDNTQLSKKDYLHFLFFLIVFAGTLPYIFSDTEFKINVARIIVSNQWGELKYRPNAIVPPHINRYLRPFHAFAYATATWILIYHYRHKIFQINKQSGDFLVIKKWLMFFAGFFLLMSLFYVVMAINFNPHNKAIFISRNHILMIAFSSTFLSLLITLLLFPKILYGLPVRIETLYVNAIHETDDLNIESLGSIVTSVEKLEGTKDPKKLQLFSEEYLQEISQKTQIWINEKHFLEKEVTLANMAGQVQIPLHHLSYYFNVILLVKFTDWKNSHRVNYAKLLLDQSVVNSITLEALSERCGFASQTTFNRAFKNVMGITPSQYLKLKG